MSAPRDAPLSSRRRPRQARSAGLVAAVLEAAVQVLRDEGAARFTTARVAERAGVSVGSLYQYFPNKAAILFRLQADEWARTADLLGAILADTGLPPPARLRALAHAFVRSECEEAAVRGALADAAPLYRGAPEARDARAGGMRALRLFLAEALPGADEEARALAGDTVAAALSAVGKRASELARTPAEVETRAAALADMLCAYLQALGAGGAVGAGRPLSPPRRRRG